ncbi:HupE/UreJ family protein [Pseudorhizobium sp. NPDC055634]
MFRRVSIAATVSLAAAAPALAHLDPAEHGSFMAGVSHPLFGTDHVLAMVAVGLWASQVATASGERRALFAIPAAFVATMVLGFAAAVAAFPLPFVEPVILASVIALGLLVAMAVRMPVALSAAVVGVFAFFHGHAHGGELGAAGALRFGLGFMLATALLHAAGIGAGLAIGRLAPWAARVAGGLTALAGLSLALG